MLIICLHIHVHVANSYIIINNCFTCTNKLPRQPFVYMVVSTLIYKALGLISWQALIGDTYLTTSVMLTLFIIITFNYIQIRLILW